MKYDSKINRIKPSKHSRKKKVMTAYPLSQSNLTMVPGVKAKVDFLPLPGVESCPQETTWRKNKSYS